MLRDAGRVDKSMKVVIVVRWNIRWLPEISRRQSYTLLSNQIATKSLNWQLGIKFGLLLETRGE
jgi:hypothetical protein